MRARKLGCILAQKKIDEVWRLTPEQWLLITLEHSDAATLFYRAGSKKDQLKLPGFKASATLISSILIFYPLI
jgi:hypothetical protein